MLCRSLTKIFTLLFVLYCSANTYAEQYKHVILITIDGMRGEMITDKEMPSPFLKSMKANGTFIKKVTGICPSSTYPSHTTIVTGALPSSHKIYYNSPFVENKDTTVSYWYADSIKVPTLWQAAKENGLTTASLFWPVSTKCDDIDYNIPEYWSVKRVSNQLDFIKPYCTPYGILEEIEEYAVGKLDHSNFGAGTLNRDAKTAYMANYIMNKYNPGLMTIHLITTDYAQHATGLSSQRVKETVASADNAVGLIVENLRLTGKMDSTVVVVCGDHGFSSIETAIAPNVWLTKMGLLSEKPGGEWKACFHRGGATMFLYLKDKDDKKTLKQIKKMLSELPESTKGLFKIYDNEQLISMGADPECVLAIEPIKGVTCLSNRTGEDVFEKKGGNHGYMSGIDQTSCIIYGTKAKGKEFDIIRQIDIAPYVMYLLGVDYKFADGSIPEFLIK